MHVVVVDDGSPAPTEPEIACIAGTSLSVQVIKQANGGPGMARNTGGAKANRFMRYRIGLQFLALVLFGLLMLLTRA